MSYDVTPDDIEARWRPLTSDETTVATTLLADAEALLDNALPGLAAAVDDETVSLTIVTAVIVAMVVRVLRNPDGVKSETIGDYSYVRDSSDSGLLLLESDLSPLTTALGALSGGGFTIRPYYEPPADLATSFE
jgi:hypothetical protein